MASDDGSAIDRTAYDLTVNSRPGSTKDLMSHLPPPARSDVIMAYDNAGWVIRVSGLSLWESADLAPARPRWSARAHGGGRDLEASLPASRAELEASLLAGAPVPPGRSSLDAPDGADANGTFSPLGCQVLRDVHLTLPAACVVGFTGTDVPCRPEKATSMDSDDRRPTGGCARQRLA